MQCCCAPLEVSLNLQNSEPDHTSESGSGDGSLASSPHCSLRLPHVTDLCTGQRKKKKKFVLLAIEHHRKPNRYFAPSPSFGLAKRMKRFLHLGFISSNTTNDEA